MKEQKRLPRLSVQLACLSIALAMLWPLPQWIHAPKLIPQTSPFFAICSSIFARTFGVGTGIGFGFASVALFRRRWFCRYVCPTGLLLEGTSRIGFRKTVWWARCPSLGRYVALGTAAGSIFGYPILLWMDPLAILSSSFAVRTAGDALSGILAGSGLGLLLLIGLTSGPLWCVHICPLGATQELLLSIRSFAARKLNAGQSQPAQLASEIVRHSLTRRVFLVMAAGAGLGAWAKKIGAGRGENAPLRPPGAVDERFFAGLCVRCNNCARICPSKIIYPDTGQAGIAGFLAPTIRYEAKYCLKECNACTQACPSGALQALTLKQKNLYIIGEALVDGEICWLTLGKKECDACIRACPYDAVRIHWDESQYAAYPVIDHQKCNGCGACEAACPTGEIRAIRVWRSTRYYLASV